MKIYFIVSIARQYDGEMISVRFEKAFKTMEKAESYTKDLSKTYNETIQTPDGPINFFVSRGIHMIDVEE